MTASVASVLAPANGEGFIEQLGAAINAASSDKTVSDADLGALVRILLRLSSRSEVPAAAAEKSAEAPKRSAPPPVADDKAKKPNGSGQRAKRTSRRPRVTYDDRVKIKARHEQHMQGRQRPESGFIAGLATEFGCSDGTIYAILKE
jgi:hypothetical protein